MIRVLVAEDSQAARLLLVSLLERDPEIKVVGEVGDGEAAVAGAKRLRPDVITMDIHMPLLDGLQATARIMNEAPTPIVVVSSAVNAQDVASSFAAMKAGALVALPKPGMGGGAQGEEDRRSFVSTVKAMARVKVVRRWSAASGGPKPLVRITRTADRSASGGAPAFPGGHRSVDRRPDSASGRHFSTLPASFPVPIVIVQHIARGFLCRVCPIAARSAAC